MDYESTLNEKQKTLLKEFLSTRSEPLVYLEEDCCGMRDYHFEITPSGIGDSVFVVCGKDRLWLDDGLES